MVHGDGLETYLGGAVTDFLPLQLKDARGSRLMVHGKNNGKSQKKREFTCMNQGKVVPLHFELYIQ